MNIREAVAADAERLIHVHYESVHGTPARCYTPEIIDAWSRSPDEGRYQWMRQIISGVEHLVVVAEQKSDVLGFGIIIPGLGELRALYVHPRAGRKGVGTTLLGHLETRATGLLLSVLRLRASTNASSFYERNGYRVLSTGTLQLSGELSMDCVNMEKRL